MLLLKSFRATKGTLTSPGLDCVVVPTTPAAVAVNGLVKRYGRQTAVHDLDLVAPAGAITALLGPNGAGKTTTIECCEGLRRPDGGTVRVLGLDPHGDARALRPRVGVMLQDGGLPSTAPALQVLHHVATMYADPSPPDVLADRLGLHAFARTQVRRLSGGQRQRLALAAAVVGRPEVAFLDEPTAGLDPQARLAVLDLIRELRDAGTSVVVTTHQMTDAEDLADQVVIVDHGRCVAAGPVSELVGAAGVVRFTVRGTDVRAVDDVPDLAARLGAAVQAGAQRPQVTVTGTTVEVQAAADPDLVHAIARWAADEGLLISALTAGRRTLEDVFLDLTGRSLR